MDALAQLSAESACRELIVSAADAVDRQDYDALVQLFTDDATLVRPGGHALRGRAEIFQSYTAKDPNRLTYHLVCNHHVKVLANDTAQSRCKVLLYVTDKTSAMTPQGRLADRKHQIGTLEDELLLTPEGWKIHRRTAWFDVYTEG